MKGHIQRSGRRAGVARVSVQVRSQSRSASTWVACARGHRAANARAASWSSRSLVSMCSLVGSQSWMSGCVRRSASHGSIVTIGGGKRSPAVWGGFARAVVGGERDRGGSGGGRRAEGGAVLRAEGVVEPNVGVVATELDFDISWQRRSHWGGNSVGVADCQPAVAVYIDAGHVVCGGDRDHGGMSDMDGGCGSRSDGDGVRRSFV